MDGHLLSALLWKCFCSALVCCWKELFVWTVWEKDNVQRWWWLFVTCFLFSMTGVSAGTGVDGRQVNCELPKCFEFDDFPWVCSGEQCPWVCPVIVAWYFLPLTSSREGTIDTKSSWTCLRRKKSLSWRFLWSVVSSCVLCLLGRWWQRAISLRVLRGRGVWVWVSTLVSGCFSKILDKWDGKQLVLWH